MTRGGAPAEIGLTSGGARRKTCPRMLRTVVAAGLALFLVFTAGAPHVHEGAHGVEHCAVCVARHADVPLGELPDLAPVPALAVEIQLAPGLAPVTGAPLGAIPGQSPPRSA